VLACSVELTGIDASRKQLANSFPASLIRSGLSAGISEVQATHDATARCLEQTQSLLELQNNIELVSPLLPLLSTARKRLAELGAELLACQGRLNGWQKKLSVASDG
jgi:hypothetical protein